MNMRTPIQISAAIAVLAAGIFTTYAAKANNCPNMGHSTLNATCGYFSSWDGSHHGCSDGSYVEGYVSGGHQYVYATLGSGTGCVEPIGFVCSGGICNYDTNCINASTSGGVTAGSPNNYCDADNDYESWLYQ